MIRRLGGLLALTGVALVLLFYGEMLTHAPVTGQDFRNFYAAATLLRHGGNPYDRRQFVRQEERLYRPTTAEQRASLRGNPYVQGPPLAIALMPVVGLPPDTVYHVYAALLAACAIAALALLAARWPLQRAVPRALLLLLSPVTFLGLLLGQPDAVLLLALVLALWVLDKDHAALAGFLLAVGLIKPQLIAGPIVLLALLALRRGRGASYLAGLAGGILVFIGGSVLIAGPRVVLGWIGELASFGGATVYSQVDISSVSTLYVGWAPHIVALALSVAGVLAWAVLCLPRWHGHLPRWHGDMSPHAERCWFCLGLAGWLLVTPYAHPHDDILLLPVAWYLLDHRLRHGAAALLAILLVASWWLLPMTSVLGLRPPLLRGLGIVPVLLLATAVWLRRPRPRFSSALQPRLVVSESAS